MDIDAAEQLFLSCDKDRDGFISRKDLEGLCEELQLEASVDELMQQLGADDQGKVGFAQFLLCHKHLDLGPSGHTNPNMTTTDHHQGVWRRRENKDRPKTARHWDWLGQAMDSSVVIPLLPTPEKSKEQLLLERRQQKRLEKSEPQQPKQGDEDEENEEIADLTRQLAKVTAQRDEARKNEDFESQCQRYEEKIVELHSVIAELSRKLQCGREDMIPEESESCVTDSCIEEEDEEDDIEGVVGISNKESKKFLDENSVAFERDISSHNDFDEEYIEELQNEVAEAKSDNQKLRQVVAQRDRELVESDEAIRRLQHEREALKRQLIDLQSTLEFQEAKMDRNGRSSAERRSLRKKKSTGAAAKPCITPTSPEPSDFTGSDNRSRGKLSPFGQVQELELELAKCTSQIDHLKSQNDVLELTLDDARSTSEKLSIQLARHESNATAMHLALAYADQAIEAYDVLVALLETEVASKEAEGDPKKAQANKRSALSVARHLICRYDKTFQAHHHRTDSGMGYGSSWEADSSGYSHTTTSSSTTSTTSSTFNDELLHQHKSEETRLREHICQLKTIRATIQGTVVDLEPVLKSSCSAGVAKMAAAAHHSDHLYKEEQIEAAVIRQELMAAKEEIADLKAKIYVSEKEKLGLELTVKERRSMESMLRTHLKQLQDQLNPNPSHNSITEEVLRQRVDNLLETLDSVIRNSDLRQTQSNDLIADLKRANSTLSEALDKTKRKYQSKIKRLEQQLTHQAQQLPTASNVC